MRVETSTNDARGPLHDARRDRDPQRDRLPIAPLLAQRWSPRGFDADHVINSDELVCIVEAARWAPSAGNTQPWAFAAARRGTEAFAAIHATLAGFNQVWTPAASALLVFAVVPERAGR